MTAATTSAGRKGWIDSPFPFRGVSQSKQRHQPDRRKPRLRDRKRNEQENKVVQPHDGSEREGGCEREGERPKIVPAPAEDHATREQRDSEQHCDEPGGAVAESECAHRADERVAVRRLEIGQTPQHRRVALEPCEPEPRPGDERDASSDEQGIRRRTKAARRERPHEERPENDLGRRGQTDRRSERPGRGPIAPRERGGERDQS